MTGITPAVLIRSGIWVDWPPYMRRPTTRLAYCTGIFRCPSCITMTAAVTATIMTRSPSSTNSLSSPVADAACTSDTIAEGRRTTMPAKMMSEIPLPIPFSEICSPSHMISAVPVVSVIMVRRRNPQPGSGTMTAAAPAPHALEPHRDAERLDQRQHDGAVARVLGDLLLPRLALLGEPLERGDHHGEELQDDGGGDVRHDPQREDGQAAQVAAREEVDHAEQGALHLVEELREGGRRRCPGSGTWAPSRYAASRPRVTSTRRLSSGILAMFRKLCRPSIMPG